MCIVIMLFEGNHAITK